MKTNSILTELQNAKAHSYAIGAFNIFNYLSARAVIRGAQKLALPVILQTSMQTVRRFGPEELGTMLRQLAWNASTNVIIHLDHCTNLDMAKACMDAGWDSIMFDGSALPLEKISVCARRLFLMLIPAASMSKVNLAESAALRTTSQLRLLRLLRHR